MPDEDDDLFADLVCLNDSWEAQMVFHQELPMVMDETEAGHHWQQHRRDLPRDP